MDDATTMLLPAATKEPPPGPKKYVPTTFDVMRELSGTAEGRMLIMKFIIKCSDISHPARTFPIHKRWSELIQEEFFRQGDKEAKLGLPVSRGMDRHSADNKVVTQVGVTAGYRSKLLHLEDVCINNLQMDGDTQCVYS